MILINVDIRVFEHNCPFYQSIFRYGVVPNLYENNAEFYDCCLSNQRLNADIPFFIESAKVSPGPVLEVCCGTGRVLLELVRNGIEADGIDLSEGMLSVLERKLAAESEEIRSHIKVYRQDMRAIELPRKYGLIILPFNSFMFLTEDTDIKECLRGLREHLLPAGKVIMSIHNVDYLDLVVLGEEETLNVTTLPNGDVIKYVGWTTEIDEKKKVMVSMFRHDTYSMDILKESTDPDIIITRYYECDEICNILKDNGFIVNKPILGAFDGSIFEEGSEQMIIRASLKR